MFNKVKTIVIIVFCFWSLPFCYGETNKPLLFENNIINAGDVIQGKEIQAEFKYIKKTEGNIDKLDIHVGCNCVFGDSSSENKKNSEGKGAILLTINTERKFGRSKNTAIISYIFNGEVFQQELTVNYNVIVDGKVVTINNTACDLGKRTPNEILKKQLMLKRFGDKEFETQIKSIKSPSWIKINSITKDPNEYSWRVSLDATIPNEYGMIQDYLYVHTNDTHFPVTSIPVLCIVEKAITAEPSRILKYLQSEEDQSCTFSIKILDKEKRNIHIDKVIFKNNQHAFSVEIDSQKNVLQVTSKGLIRSHSFLKDVMEIEVTVYGQIETISVPIFIINKKT